MMRAPILATAFVLVAGASLAAPPLEGPGRAPGIEPRSSPTDWSAEGLVVPNAEASAGEIVIARKGRGGGGRRGGAMRKSRGGFRGGNRRHAERHGGRPGVHGDFHGHHHVGHGHHDLDVDRNINVDRDINVNDNDDKWGAAIVGGVVGMGIGAAINDQSQPQYYNQPPPEYYDQY